MGDDSRSPDRAGKAPQHFPNRRDVDEADGDAAWLLWEATLLATALDAQQHTHIRKEFPDFGPWAFTCETEETKQHQEDSRLFYAMCVRLLGLLQCEVKAFDADDSDAASKAIAETSVAQLQCPTSIDASELAKGQGTRACFLIYWLLLKVAESRRLSFGVPMYPSKKKYTKAKAVTGDFARIEAEGMNAEVPERIVVTFGELKKAKESPRSLSAVIPACTIANMGGSCSGNIWRQQVQAVQCKQGDFQRQMRQLGTLLPLMAEEGQRVIASMRQQEKAAHLMFSDIFPQYQTLLKHHRVHEEHQRRLQGEIQSLKIMLETSEERVRETTQALAEATKLRVTSRPAASLANFIYDLQEELKQLDVRAAILRHALIHAQPDAAADDGDDAEEIPTLD